jgi:hypothetical protein
MDAYVTEIMLITQQLGDIKHSTKLVHRYHAEWTAVRIQPNNNVTGKLWSKNNKLVCEVETAAGRHKARNSEKDGEGEVFVP